MCMRTSYEASLTRLKNVKSCITGRHDVRMRRDLHPGHFKEVGDTGIALVSVSIYDTCERGRMFMTEKGYSRNNP